MANDTFRLIPGKTNTLDQQLGYFARSVFIDNYTNYQISLGTGRVIPPATVSVVVRLDGPQKAQASLVGAPTSGAVGSTYAQLTYTDGFIPESAGTGIASSGTSISPAGVPSALQSIINQGVTLTSVSAAAQNLINVPDSSIFGVGDLILILNMPAVTSQLVTVTQITSPTQIKVSANLTNQANAGDALEKVIEVALNGLTIINGVLQVAIPTANQPVATREAAASLATMKIVPIANTVASGANAVLIAAVANQTVNCFACSMVFDAVVAASGMNLQDTAGDTFAQFSSVIQAPPLQEYHGGTEATQSPVGLGIRIQNPSGSSMTVRGHLAVTQG